MTKKVQNYEENVEKMESGDSDSGKENKTVHSPMFGEDRRLVVGDPLKASTAANAERAGDCGNIQIFENEIWSASESVVLRTNRYKTIVRKQNWRIRY